MLTVRVNVPKSVLKNQPFLEPFQGSVRQITRIRRFENRPPDCRYYELEGAVSPKGLPYGFMRSWFEAIMIRVE